MGGFKTYGGRKTYQRTHSAEILLDPSKRASGLLCRGFLYRKNRVLTPERGGERTVRGGGPKPLLGRGVIREVFHPPLFPPPHGVLWQMYLCHAKYQGEGIAPFWGAANLPEKVSCDMGYYNDSIAISRNTGPLRQELGGSSGLETLTCTKVWV